MQNTKRLKSIIYGAIILVGVLLLCCVFEIVGINRKRNQLENQKRELSELNAELAFYNDQQISNAEKDSKNPDGEIIIEE